jgi:glycolate oxidase FAD binding subunit
VVKGGGRVVKNVSGYDLPRLFTGSLGSLGVITSVCLKLWPLTEATATAQVAAPAAAEEVHRPLAILESRQGVSVLLAGTGPEVDDQVRRLGGDFSTGLDYPAPLRGEAIWSIRVPPSSLGDAVSRIPAGSDFVAQHGVGVVDFGVGAAFDVSDLREWAESRAGAVVRLAGAPSADPWGTAPPGLALQRRVVEAFDPVRILEPGRLPGRI